MKKMLISSFLMISLILISPLKANADCPAIHKLTRGVITIVTSPLEIPKQSRIYWKRGAEKTPHVLVWIFCGAVKGVVNMVTRIGSGAWDTLTFPIPIPKDYKPLVDTQKSAFLGNGS